jgi:DNA-binding Lrp family transcriptional regulator
VTKQLDIPRDLLERLYYEEGLSRQKIADRLGCTEWIVRSQMERYGLPARRPWDYRRIDIPEGLLRRLYYEEGLSQVKIAERIGCDERVIRDRMREFGMEPKSPADYKWLHIPEALVRKLYCQDGLSLTQIAEQLGCSQTVILRRLQTYGIDRRPRGGTAQYKVPKDVLSTWSPELAYVVGLVTTDGNLKSDRPDVSFASTDIEIVEAYRRILKVNAPIYVTQSDKGHKPLHRVCINDPAYRTFLENVGLMPVKAKRLGVLGIPDVVFRDFLRGCIDGDGSIRVAVYKQAVYKDGDRRLLVVTLYSSSLPFLKWVRNTVERLTGLRCNVNANRKSCDSLTSSGLRAVSLLRWIYYKSDLACLTRKRDIFETYVRSKGW